MLGKRWEMLRWLTSFLQENQEAWEESRIEREKENEKSLNDWEKTKRFEKIKILKEKFSRRSEENSKDNEKLTAEQSWKTWRKSIINSPENPSKPEIPPVPPPPSPEPEMSPSLPPVEPKMEEGKTCKTGKGDSPEVENECTSLRIDEKPGVPKDKEEEEQKQPQKIIKLKAPTKLDNPKKKTTTNNKKQQTTKNKKTEYIPRTQMKISDMLKKKEIDDRNETPCTSGEIICRKVTKPPVLEKNMTDGEAPCKTSDVIQVEGESLQNLGCTNEQPDLATKLSLMR